MPASRRGSIVSGFSLVELLIVMALIAILALIGLPWMLSTLNRTKLVGAAREAATLMQMGRLEAIKRGVQTQVQYDAGADSLVLIADNDGSGTFAAGTDLVLARGERLPKTISLWGPTDSAPEEANAILDWDDAPGCLAIVIPPADVSDYRPGPFFRTDGSVNCAGAFRFADTHGNFLEIRILFPATGKIAIRKWFGGSDPDAQWFENGEANNKWTW